METAASIEPSPEARRLFSRMVARSDVQMTLGLADTIALSVHRKRKGQDPTAQQAVQELMGQGWIVPEHDGGWKITT